MGRFMFTAAVTLSISICAAKNFDINGVLTEQGKIRSEYLSKAGTLPKFNNGAPTGETYHGNCCGEADAYEADDYEIDPEGNLWAILTCNDPDNCKEIPGEYKCWEDVDTSEETCGVIGKKIVRPPGSKWPIPPKIVLKNFEPINNTGHGWVYITDSEDNPVPLCWAAPAGL